MDSWSVRSHLQPQCHFHETDGCTQNRRQKVVNREALCLCRGGLDIQCCQKLHWFITFHISILGSLELYLGG